MNAKILLRIASVITFLYFGGHTAGIPWTPVLDEQTIPMLDTMKSHRIEAMGASRYYWDFYFGFGLVISGFLLVQALVFWQLGELAKDGISKIRPILAFFSISFIVNAAFAWKFFFAPPAAMAIAIAICLVLAFVAIGRTKPQFNV